MPTPDETGKALPGPLAEAAIARIAHGVLDCSLPKAEWTHAAHFAAALWLLREGRVAAEEGSMAPIIRRYNEATGTANTPTSGYHETITLASLRGAEAYLAAAPDTPLEQILAAVLAGPLGSSGWPLAFWSKGLLMSAEARLRWIAPDLQPLPW